ncbi:MAG: hypothetical protein LBS62_00625 [Clostridiales bacterium]|jgi:hypothetical protein|nr:hypothetical protein [Clostridiales bacterium]
MKKTIAILTAAVFTLAAVTTVFAHGHSRAGRMTDTAGNFGVYPICQVESCALGYAHFHELQNYQPHHAGDGHDYHALCTVTDCLKTTVHTHDDTVYLPHFLSDGHGTSSNHKC